jgi:hypothetical protein
VATSDAAREVKGKAREAKGMARDVSASPVFRALVSVGLLVVGGVHILIGVLALQMAWSAGPDQEADQKGALQALSANPAGGIILWVVAVALCGLVLWKLTQAWWGYGYESKRAARIRKRIGALGGAVMYLLLAITAIRFSLGDSSQSSDSAQQSRVGLLLSQPYGQVLAVLAAAVVVGYAAVLVKRGVTASFTKELAGEPAPAMKRFGQAGFVAKGVSIALIGVMFGWAAVTYDPDKAAGLDDSLRLVNQQSAGPILLTIIALGLIAYGLYCFSWARHARH